MSNDIIVAIMLAMLTFAIWSHNKEINNIYRNQMELKRGYDDISKAISKLEDEYYE